MNPWGNRCPEVREFEELFYYSHLPEHLQVISQAFGELAQELLHRLHDGTQLIKALDKLVEAKDAAVRQAVKDARA